MKVLIVGAGAVGFDLARRLADESQDVVVVDNEPERIEFISNQLDVLAIGGNGASIPVLSRAGVRDAGLILSVTSRDEVNLIASMAGKRMGAKRAIARISSPEYYQSGNVLSGDALGIDRMVNPERECARETYNLLRSEIATEVIPIADGLVYLIGLRLDADAPVLGRSLSVLGEEQAEAGKRRYSAVAVMRGDRTIIPRGDTVLEAGDKTYLLCPPDAIADIGRLAGKERSHLQRVMIAGGSAEGERLARILCDNGISCTLVERDKPRSHEIAKAVPKALVMHADATHLELLEMEGVSGVDGFVAATGSDETNLLVSLLAKSAGAPKVISLVHEFDNLRLVPKVGIDAAVSPRMSTVNAIMRYVRRGKVATLAEVIDASAEALEYVIEQETPVAGRPLREDYMPAGAVVGAIVRDGKMIVPHGDDAPLPGDEVIVFALRNAVRKVAKLFT
ncbi:MAG: Trk system potassium transporter TrkA [Gemmatimonadetes bacterium]|nr:Trk system potassium transporter TrkA [Gemmatimonadota bacterium]